MLVLSRRESDKILFPTLGISVEVLRVQGNRTRLGITAPTNVPVLRHEIANLKDIEFAPGKHGNDRRLQDLVHAIRQRLDVTTTNLNELDPSLDGEQNDHGKKLIDDLFGELRCLEQEANKMLGDSGVSVNETPQALLAEDEPNERRLLESYLELCGFNVTTAEDGQEAIDYLSLHARPDVVLLDMMMPRIDGPTFVRTVRADKRYRGLPIFALTGMQREEIDLPTGTEGVDRWYVKPVNPKEVVSDIATHITNAPILVS